MCTRQSHFSTPYNVFLLSSIKCFKSRLTLRTGRGRGRMEVGKEESTVQLSPRPEFLATRLQVSNEPGAKNSETSSQSYCRWPARSHNYLQAAIGSISHRLFSATRPQCCFSEQNSKPWHV